MADEVVSIRIELDNGQVLAAFDRAKKRAEDSAKEVEAALNKAGANSTYADRVFGNFQKKAEEASKNALTGKAVDYLKNNAQNAGVQVSQEFNNGFSDKLKDILGVISKEFPIAGRAASSGISLITVGLGSLITTLGVTAAALYVVKKAIDASFDGEKLIATGIRFNKLAESAGLSGVVMQEAFTKAAAGLVDTSDILDIANVGLATYGKNAGRLPELFEVARKASLLLGESSVDVYEKIQQAVQNGNQKALKNIGIVLDTDKVYKDFAKSIGLVASELNESQKQAALLDAVISKGNATYANVATGITPASTALKSLGVSFNEVIESAEKVASRILSGPISSVLNATNGFLKNFIPQSDIEKANEYNKKIDELTLKINEAKKAGKEVVFFEGFPLSINQATNSMAKLMEKFSALPQAARNSAIGVVAAGENIKNEAIDASKVLTTEQIAARNARDASLKAEILNTQSATLQSQMALLQYEDDFNARKTEKQRILSEQLRILNEQEQAKLTQIDQQFKTGQITNEALYLELKLAQQKDYEEKRKAITKAGNDEQKRQSDAARAQGQMVSSSLVSLFSNAAQRIGASLIQGGKAFEDFKNAALGIVGDLVIKLGESLVATGLGIDALKTALSKLTGAPAIIAGLGLIALGGLLKASGGVGVPTSTGGGGVASGGGLESPGTPAVDNPQTVAQEPSTKVNVVINGSVLDSDETGLRIVDLLNNAFDKQGVTVRQSA